jgi:hypothetical protein
MNKLIKGIAVGAGVAAASYAGYVATTWLRYGRNRPPRGRARDALLDTFMPRYDVHERHVVPITAPPEVALGAAAEQQLDSSRIVRAIFKGRELLLRSRPDATPRRKGLLEFTQSIGWRVLAESSSEIVMGAVTRPWEANPVFRPIAPEAFAAFSEPDYVKIAWTLRAEPRHDGGTLFWTETRVVATDASARRKFRRYWAFLSPGIILIRKAMLAALPALADRAWHLEGDDILPGARTQLTHATMIGAPTASVWPWLVQMGCQRAGWYSWDRLDNGGTPSADHIIPELQHLAVGDVLPFRPEGPDGFDVVRIVPGRALVVHSKGPLYEGTWAFVLEPHGDRTRLVTRYRATYEPSSTMAVMLPVLAGVHAIMERKQLRTIKHHAETITGHRQSSMA